MSHELTIRIVQGDTAPRYDRGCELKISHVTITEQGTSAHLPIVDFVAHDALGNQYLMVLTGRLVNMVSAAIRGANMRNHGVEEP